MRLIKSDELPDWFELSRYEDALSLDLAGWHQNLRPRAVFFNLTEDQFPTYKPLFFPFLLTDASLIISTDSNDPDNDRLGQNAQEFQALFSGIEQATVRSLPASYAALAIAACRNTGQKLHADTWLAKSLISGSEYMWQGLRSGGDIAPDDDIDEFLNTPMDVLERRNDEFVTVPILHAEINMFAPDSMILEDFKKWLKAAREKFNMPARNMFTTANMDSWVRNQVLAYVDLTNWARFNNSIIGQETMGCALFPDDIEKDAASRIRKTVKDKANYLMRPSVVDAILTQCLSEGHKFT